MSTITPPTLIPAQSQISDDEWNLLWTETHNTLYETYYEEFQLEALLERWERLSTVSRFVLTITAPGSAIAGWALWNMAGFKYIWVVIAGLGAICVALEATLHMNERIKEQTILLTEFRSLRTDIKTFEAQMNIKALPEVKNYKDAFLVIRERFSKASSKLRNDLWLTQHVKDIAQSRLNILFPR
jgi:hypothetical protein